MAMQVTNDRSPPQLVPLKPVATGEVPPAGARPADAGAKEAELQATARKPVPEASVSEIVGQMAQIIRRDLNFSLDEDSGKMVVKIIDAESQETVRQIPPEELLALARRLQQIEQEQSASGDQLKGLLLTTKA
ncbi:MAG: flagellar protein FlaG [Gammaproteobacteria bacterium]|nr:flagellar protein FlaG [Gammaproteobacteria bacterium]